MEFAFDQQTEDIRGLLLDVIVSHDYPAEPAFAVGAVLTVVAGGLAI